MISIFAGVILLVFFIFLGYILFYRVPQALKITAWFRFRKLRRRYKDNFEFDDSVVNLCKLAIARKWKYRDMLKITKGSTNRDEILYTYYLIRKLPRDEIMKGGLDETGFGKSKGEIAETLTKALK
jgi:hypothetical protein